MIRLAIAVLVALVVGTPLAILPAAPVSWLAIAAAVLGGGGVLALSVSLVTASASLSLIGYALAVWWARTAAEPIVSVILGGALYLMGHRPVHELHYLYAAGMGVTLGVTFTVGRRTPWPLSRLPLVIGAVVAVVFAVLALNSG